MYEHDDDRPVGRLLSRRDAVKLLGVGGAAALLPIAHGSSVGASSGPFSQAGGVIPSCVVKPEMTEGPYFVDTKLMRSDIRDGRSGHLLRLAVTVVDVTDGACKPLPNAIVDVWQCDAKGVYSGVNDGAQGFNTVGETFLRGQQATDDSGLARFTTIYPGWYAGRTVHIHFKIRTAAAAGAYEFTSQWYFDETLNETMLAGADYARPGRRDTMNSNDGIYRDGGDQLLLVPTGSAEGLLASFAIGLDLANAAVGRADGRGGGRGPGPGPGRGRRGGGRLG